MKQLTLLLTTSIILASCGNNKLPSELTQAQELGLKGKVKSIEKTFYHFCEYDGESWKPTTNSSYYKAGVSFDKNGFKTQTTTTTYYPTLDPPKSSTGHTWQRISKDNKTIAYTLSRQDTLGKQIIDTYKIVWINDHILLEYQNNEKGDTLFSSLTKYDDNNLAIFNKEKTRLNDGSYIRSIYKYFYNKDGLPIKDSVFSNMDNEPEVYEIIHKERSTDKHGNIIYEFIEQHRNGDTSNMIKTVAIEYYD